MTQSGVPERRSTARIQRNALIGQTESNERQAQALERIAAALEFLCDHMYPAAAESVLVTPEEQPAEVPMEVDHESGATSEI